MHIKSQDVKPTGYISLDPTKCVVIVSNAWKTELWKKQDNQIERKVGKFCNKVIIDEISKTRISSQNLIVQLASEEMASQVIGKWGVEIPGGPSVWKPEEEKRTFMGRC